VHPCANCTQRPGGRPCLYQLRSNLVTPSKLLCTSCCCAGSTMRRGRCWLVLPVFLLLQLHLHSAAAYDEPDRQYPAKKAHSDSYSPPYHGPGACTPPHPLMSSAQVLNRQQPPSVGCNNVTTSWPPATHIPGQIYRIVVQIADQGFHNTACSVCERSCSPMHGLGSNGAPWPW
jgi:hypothetical protein